jgi:hypothetical protein
LDPSSLDIERLIVHTVPSKGLLEDGTEPEVTVHGAISPLGEAELNFVRNRVLSSLREDSYGAMFDPDLADVDMVDHIDVLTTVGVSTRIGPSVLI